MSSPPTTPTVASATLTTSATLSSSASPSQSNDGNGGPSSSLYLYADNTQNSYAHLLTFHFCCFLLYNFRYCARACTRGGIGFGVWCSASTLRPKRKRKRKRKRIIQTGSPSSRLYSYCYSSRRRLSFGLSSSVVVSGDASKKLSSLASYRLHRPAV